MRQALFHPYFTDEKTQAEKSPKVVTSTNQGNLAPESVYTTAMLFNLFAILRAAMPSTE